jgi:hypothetical protein
MFKQRASKHKGFFLLILLGVLLTVLLYLQVVVYAAPVVPECVEEANVLQDCRDNAGDQFRLRCVDEIRAVKDCMRNAQRNNNPVECRDGHTRISARCPDGTMHIQQQCSLGRWVFMQRRNCPEPIVPEPEPFCNHLRRDNDQRRGVETEQGQFWDQCNLAAAQIERNRCDPRQGGEGAVRIVDAYTCPYGCELEGSDPNQCCTKGNSFSECKDFNFLINWSVSQCDDKTRTSIVSCNNMRFRSPAGEVNGVCHQINQYARCVPCGALVCKHLEQEYFSYTFRDECWRPMVPVGVIGVDIADDHCE